MTSTIEILDDHSKKVLMWLLIPLFFLPKVNLISFGGGETAGLRLDDVFLFLFSSFFFFAALSVRKRVVPIEKGMYALTALSLFSFAFNQLLYTFQEINVSASILYALRPLEYFLFFYIGQMAYGRLSLRGIMLAFLFWNACVMVLQWFSVLPAVSVDGFMYVSGRIPGIASFPSEMGAILNLIFCALLFERSSFKTLFTKEIIPYSLFIFIGALVLLTASRASLVAHLVLFIVFLKTSAVDRKRARFFLGFLFLCMGGAIFMAILPHIEEIYERSLSLFSWSNLDLISDVWHHIETSYNPLGHESVDFHEEYDLSWWIRIHKWCYALKLFTMHPECYIQGIGPGIASAGLDGGIVRILVELGVLGLFLTCFLFKRIMDLSLTLQWMIAALVMNMLFFDAHLAYKPMSLLFFSAGYSSIPFFNEKFE